MSPKFARTTAAVKRRIRLRPSSSGVADAVVAAVVEEVAVEEAVEEVAGDVVAAANYFTGIAWN